MSNILVVGSAGYTGSNLVNYMLQLTKSNIASIDNLPGGKRDMRNLAGAADAKRHKMYIADISDEYITSRILEVEEPEIIIYNAVDTFGSKVDEAIKLASLLRGIASCKQKPRKLLVLYSRVYDNADWYSQLNDYIYENVKKTCESNGVSWYVVKTVDTFGPRQKFRYSIPNIINGIVNNKDVSTSEESRQYLYIRDLYVNLMKFLNDKHTSGKYALTSGKSASTIEIYKYLSQVVKSDSDSELQYAQSDSDSVFEDSSTIQCSVQYDLSTALQHTLVWYTSNKWFWE